jgi:quinol monooxygenase YgiN
MPDPFVMEVRLFLKPECKDEYLVALDKVIGLARAEPTCRYLLVFESAEDPNTIVLLESWADMQTFRDEVLNRDFYRQYLAASEAMYAAPREVVQLRPLHDSDDPDLCFVADWP